jgi:flagellin
MALTVNTNIASLIAQRNLNNTNNTLTKSIERLSTGLRINRAADDAAGLALSTTLKAQIRSINQAARNANDAVSLLQTAESGLGQMSNITLRMRELAEQAANEVLGDTERGYLNDEYLALKSEINRLSDVTEFAGKKLLDGTISASGVNFQVGFQNTANDRLNVAMADTDAAALGLNTTGADSISTAALAQSVLSVIDASAIAVLSDRRGSIGAIQNRLEYTIANLQAASENFSSANSRIEDADFAWETALYVKNQILVQAGTAVLAQANVLPQAALTLLS